MNSEQIAQTLREFAHVIEINNLRPLRVEVSQTAQAHLGSADFKKLAEGQAVYCDNNRQGRYNEFTYTNNDGLRFFCLVEKQPTPETEPVKIDSFDAQTIGAD